MEGEIKGELKGIEKGIQVGLEKGIKEGRLKEKFELANKYMVNGMDKTTALDMVGLTEKEFAELSNKYS